MFCSGLRVFFLCFSVFADTIGFATNQFGKREGKEGAAGLVGVGGSWGSWGVKEALQLLRYHSTDIQHERTTKTGAHHTTMGLMGLCICYWDITG